MKAPTVTQIVDEEFVPSGAFQVYPRNQWYVAAGREELGEKLLSRRFLGEQVLLYRKENGDPIAMSDWCPHKGFTLSLSQRVGDNIRCGYHGITYNGEGKCIHIPSQKAIPPALRVRTYPAVDKWLWTWIWMGDPKLADPALIPTTGHEIRNSYWEKFFFCYPMEGNYQLLLDNVLDATHVTYLHKGLVDSEADADLTNTKPRFEYKENFISTDRYVENYVLRDHVAKMFNLENGLRVNRHLRTEHYLPGYTMIVTRVTAADDPNRLLAEQIASFPVIPAGPRSCYHFVGMSTSYPSGDPADVEFLLEIVRQDQIAIESAQRFAEECGRDAEHSIRQDEAQIRCRRMIAAMVIAERTQQM